MNQKQLDALKAYITAIARYEAERSIGRDSSYEHITELKCEDELDAAFQQQTQGVQSGQEDKADNGNV